MALDKTGSLLDQFLRDSLLVESDEAEVLWFVILGPVDGPDNLRDVSVLLEVLLDVVLLDPGGWQLPHINLARLHISLLHRASTALDGVRRLGGGCL